MNLVRQAKSALIFISALFMFSGCLERSDSNTLVKKGATHFVSVGAVTSFQWVPDRYHDATHPNPFFYDIFYYIPKSLGSSKAPVKALIFNHGGGGSTLTRQGSVGVVGLYMPDFQAIADQLGMIVVLPSANGLNWGGHTWGMMHDLVALLRNELNVDPNFIGLSGHSMGGMGITRSYIWLADEFSFFLPLAAGLDVSYTQDPVVIENQLNKVFNVRYVHLQGLQDSFDIFVSRTRDQLAKTKALESTYSKKSQFSAYFYDSPHNYNLDVVKAYLSQLFQTPRNLYQSELWGSLRTASYFAVENKITFHVGSVPRYFWVEAIETDLSKYERIDFHARVKNNVVSIDISKGLVPAQTKKFRVYLASSLEDLKKPVTVMINGKVAGVYQPKSVVPPMTQKSPSDSGFLFNDSIDVPIPQS